MYRLVVNIRQEEWLCRERTE